jgi:tetratricopeptide (TPR) repeat protein
LGVLSSKAELSERGDFPPHYSYIDQTLLRVKAGITQNHRWINVLSIETYVINTNSKKRPHKMPTTKTNEEGDDPHWAEKLLDGLNVFEINGNWHTRWHQGRYRMRPVYVGSTNKYTEDQALVRAQKKMVVKMGRWLCDQGRYDDAIMLYDAFLEKYPELPYFWVIKGQALEKSSRHSEAEAAFKKAEELQKQLAEKRPPTSDKKIVKKVGP